EIAMSNPANYGPAKAMIMAGRARGYDLSTEEGINEWMKVYQAEQVNRAMLPFGLPGAGLGLPAAGDALADLDAGLPGGAGSGSHRKSPSKVQQKAKRKMVKASQRKNRKK